jgi:plasmid stability protein
MDYTDCRASVVAPNAMSCEEDELLVRMAPIIACNVDEAIVRKLRRRAVRRGRSMNEEICDILRNAVRNQGRTRLRSGSEIAKIKARKVKPARAPAESARA